MNLIAQFDSFTPLGFIPGVPGSMELLIIAGIALLLFGNRLPGAAKSLGQSFNAFKKGIREGEDDDIKPPSNARDEARRQLEESETRD